MVANVNAKTLYERMIGEEHCRCSSAAGSAATGTTTPCRWFIWASVHDVVVEGDRQVEQVAWFDAVFDDGWLAGDAAHDQEEGLPGRRQAPATTATGHAQRCHGDRAARRYRARGIAAADGADESDEQPGQRPGR